MPKHLTEILQGVKKSSIEDLSYPDDFKPNGGDTESQKFLAIHKVEKHQDRVGNGDDIYNASKIKQAKMKRHGLSDKDQKKVNE